MNERVATITVNASVDTTYPLPRFEHGGINRVQEPARVAGGKGNNVARVLVRLGVPVVASGFLGGRSGDLIEALLNEVGARPAFYRVPGESRICITIVERDTGVITEIREAGVPLAAADGEAFLAGVNDLIGDVAIVAVSGSLLPGLPDDYYQRLTATLQAAGKRVILDTSGAPLAAGLAAGPEAIKPNREELADLATRFGLTGDDDVIRLASALAQRTPGNTTLLITLGGEGALLARGDLVLRATPPPVRPVNTVSAGDAFVAGYVHGLLDDLAPEDVLRGAVATGTAATLDERMGVVDPDLVNALTRETRVERVVERG